MITDEMVEAAAKAHWDHMRYVGAEPTWEKLKETDPAEAEEVYRASVRPILEAVEPLIRQQTADAIADAIHLKRDQRSYHETVGEWSEVSHGGVLLGLKEGEQIAREYGKGDPK